MARAALPGRLTWQIATVLELVEETPRTKSIVLRAPDWRGHLAGQHVDVRLTAEDGYQAQRSYSIASAPEDPELVLTVEEIRDGEVSPYLVDELQAGDELEVRGPIGGYFAWDNAATEPLLMLAGGSGIVPFRAMLRTWAAGPRHAMPRLVYSSRTLADVIYRDELMQFATRDQVDVRFVLTREWPDGWDGHRGRVDRELLEMVAWPEAGDPIAFVCGPNGFVESVARALMDIGYPSDRIRTERFGPSGGALA